MLGMCVCLVLGAFTKPGKATISFLMSVCPSVLRFFCLHATTRLTLDGFELNLVVEYKSGEKIHVFVIIRQKGYFTPRPIYFFYHISPSSYYNEKCFTQKL